MTWLNNYHRRRLERRRDEATAMAHYHEQTATDYRKIARECGQQLDRFQSAPRRYYRRGGFSIIHPF